MTPRAKALWLHTLTALAAACTVAVAWQTGGIDAPVLAWLMVLPIGPFYLYGRRQGYAWLLISLTLLTAVAYWAPQQSVPHGAVDMVVTLLHYVLVSSVLIWVPARYHRLYQREVEVVQQRTDALEEKRAELQATQEARNRFIASISHELRTPARRPSTCSPSSTMCSTTPSSTLGN